MRRCKIMIMFIILLLEINCGDVTREILTGTSPTAEKECRERDVFFYLLLPNLLSDTVKEYDEVRIEAEPDTKEKEEIKNERNTSIFEIFITKHLNKDMMEFCLNRGGSLHWFAP